MNDIEYRVMQKIDNEAMRILFSSLTDHITYECAGIPCATCDMHISSISDIYYTSTKRKDDKLTWFGHDARMITI